jgi:hypothetical protein
MSAEKKVVYASDVIRIRHVVEGTMHVLRGRFRRVPSAAEIEELAKAILDHVSEGEDRVAIFLGSKMDRGELTIEHLSCIARIALLYRPVIKKRVLGTKFVLRRKMTPAIYVMLEAFRTLYTPIRPFLITDSDEQSQDFETRIRKEFVNDTSSNLHGAPTS